MNFASLLPQQASRHVLEALAVPLIALLALGAALMTPEANADPITLAAPAPNSRQVEQERLAALDEAFRQEAEQSEWSAMTAALLRDVLATEAPYGTWRRLECRAQTCRLEVAGSDADAHRFVEQALQRLPDAFATARSARQPDGTTVLFLHP